MDFTWEMIIRLALAAFLGTIIGIDREYRAKSAGFRTHFLVSLGSALFMIISQYGFKDVLILNQDISKFDPSRVAAQVVTGIGFIGAGTIILKREYVKGLTTAAGLWATAGIGMACGAGLYWIGIASMILTLFGLEVLGLIFRNLDMKNISVTFSTSDQDILTKLIQGTDPKDLKIVSYKLDKKSTDPDKFLVTMEFKSRVRHDKQKLLSLLENYPDITFERIN